MREASRCNCLQTFLNLRANKNILNDLWKNNVNNDKQYLIYNYKLDKFYPFVPIGSESLEGKRRRDHEQEKKIMNEISDEIKFEKDLSLWYPIWNLPF